MRAFWTRTLTRGMSVVLPACLVAFLAAYAVREAGPPLRAIASALPLASSFPGDWALAWALILLMLACVAAGLVMDLPPVQRLIAAAQSWLAGRSRAYSFWRDVEASFVGAGRKQPLRVALADIDVGLASLAFVTEELADGRYVVFVPCTPTARDGSVYVMARSRIHLIDASVREVLPCIRLWGLGTADLLKLVKRDE